MNKLNFIVHKLPGAELLGSISTDVTLSLLINSSEDIENIPLFDLHKKEIYDNPFCHFSLCLNFQTNDYFNQQIIEKLILNKELLLQLFFHPRFEKSSNKPVLFFNQISKNNALIDLFIKTLNPYYISQGFDGIETIYLNEKHESLQATSILYNFKSEDDFQDIYYQLLVKELYVARYLGIINLPKKMFLEIINLQLETENKLMKNFPVQFHFLKQYFLFFKQTSLLEAELKYLRSDLINQKIYLQFFKDQDEAVKINQFYHNEYEILPLWYKKLGHIIKVLMGKRTFHSLFDNNVKKYKN
jgi:hypothetical protein